MKNIYTKNGILLGVVLILNASVLHAIDPRVFLNWSPWIGYIAMIYFMYRSAVETRASESGILPFGNAFIAALLPLVIGFYIYSLFTYALYNWINPGLVEIVKETAIESATYAIEKMSSMFDMDMDQDKVIEALEKEDYSFNLGKVFLSWLLTSLMGCIPALVIAAFTKRGED